MIVDAIGVELAELDDGPVDDDDDVKNDDGMNDDDAAAVVGLVALSAGLDALNEEGAEICH